MSIFNPTIAYIYTIFTTKKVNTAKNVLGEKARTISIPIVANFTL